MLQEKIYALRLMAALTMRLLVLLQKLVQILLFPDQQSSILIIMSKLLKHSALKFFSFSFLFLFTISLESKDTIVLQKYLSNIEIAKNYQDRKKGLMFRESLADDSGMVYSADPPESLWEWHPHYEDFEGEPSQWAKIEAFLESPDVSWGSPEAVVFWFEGPTMASLLLTSSEPWWGVYSCV